MEFLGRLVRCLIELAALGWVLITNSLHFLVLCTKSRATLAAENIFLQKQLAFYQERKVVPRRFDNASHCLLVLLSRCFVWKDALVAVTPKTLIGWHRKSFRLLWRWKRPAWMTSDTR
jgi:putative transposase